MSRTKVDRYALAILSAALAIGAWLRFEHLDRLDFTPGEAASWAAASAPNLREVIARALPLNPGKLGLHDVALHFWMMLFGDEPSAMRLLSATLGVLSILLAFVVARELLAASPSDDARHYEEGRDWIAATTALLFAFNLPMIYHSRNARMYMLLVPAVLVQVWFFLRANRLGGWLNYAGVTISSVLAIAAHFTAGSVMVAEALWFLPDVIRGLSQPQGKNLARSLRLIGALAGSAILLLPILRVPLSLAWRFFRGNGYSWVQHAPVLIAPIELFIMGSNEAGTGPMTRYHHIGPAFIVMSALAAWGAIRAWRSARGAVAFALLWMFVPSLLPQILSYLVEPFFLGEYALSSFIPFLFLAAIGARELGTIAAYPALMLALFVVVPPIARDRQHRSATHWHDATELAATTLGPDEFAIVDPPWMIDVVHYYLRNDKRTRVGAAPKTASKLHEPYPTLLMLEDIAVAHDPFVIQLLAMHPELLRKFEGVSVFRLSPSMLTELRRSQSADDLVGAAMAPPHN